MQGQMPIWYKDISKYFDRNSSSGLSDECPKELREKYEQYKIERKKQSDEKSNNK